MTVGLFHLAAAFDVDVLRPVDQNIADRRVLEQQLERAQAERFVEHLVDQPLALGAIEQRVFGVAEMLDDQANLAAQHVAFQLADARQVELVDQLAVNASLQVFEFDAISILPSFVVSVSSWSVLSVAATCCTARWLNGNNSPRVRNCGRTARRRCDARLRSRGGNPEGFARTKYSSRLAQLIRGRPRGTAATAGAALPNVTTVPDRTACAGVMIGGARHAA